MDWIECLYNPSVWYVASAVSCYMGYYLLVVVKKPLIATKPNGKFAEFIDKNVPLAKEKFWPTVWCIEPRAQTMLVPFVRGCFTPSVQYKREILTMKDGGEVCLDILEPKEGTCPIPNPPTLIALPGLSDHSGREYMKRLALAASEIGIRTVLFNQRGTFISLKTSRLYCAANSEDLVEVIEYVKNKYEDSLLGAVAVSMGGLILGNYLSSEDGSKTPLSCAMIISTAWNIPLTMQSLEKPGLNYMLNKYLTKRLCNIVRKLRPMLTQEQIELDDVLKSESLREFDSKFTSKLFGHKDVTDYYNHASIHDKIHKVKIPVFCLSSADDPFQPPEGIPTDVAFKMDNLCIIVTSRGGHIAFLEGMFPMHKEQYLFRLFSQYFQAFFFKGGLNHFSKEDTSSK